MLAVLLNHIKDLPSYILLHIHPNHSFKVGDFFFLAHVHDRFTPCHISVESAALKREAETLRDSHEQLDLLVC